ncbi:MAG: response regulator [Bdellovibrionota bacterium]
MRSKPIVLIIDDDPLFRKTMEAVFPRLGLNIKTTSQPAQFLEYADKLDPDLYIIDLQLTDVTGFELVKELRKTNPKAVIVVISGTKEQQDVTHALELGANDFIFKPLDRTLLASKLSRYVKTESIKEHLATFVDIPDGRAPARLSFKVEVDAIDELGVSLISRHLIPKGTVFKLKSSIFQEISPSVEGLLVSVVSNSFDSENGFYSAYAEFEEIPSEFPEALRQWMKRAQTEGNQRS